MNRTIPINKCENVCIAITLFYCLIHTILYKGDLEGSGILIILAFMCKLHLITNNITAKSIISRLLLVPYIAIAFGTFACIGGAIYYRDFLILIKRELELAPLLASYIGLISLCMIKIQEVDNYGIK